MEIIKEYARIHGLTFLTSDELEAHVSGEWEDTVAGAIYPDTLQDYTCPILALALLTDGTYVALTSFTDPGGDRLENVTEEEVRSGRRLHASWL